MPRNRIGGGLLALAAALLVAGAAQDAAAEKFSFGVMSDTQWKANLDGKNPNTVAVGIIDQLNQEFIRHGVKFVIQVGDLTDNGSAAAMQTRSDATKPLYDAGIGFFPLRGNHESSKAAAVQFQSLYPQTIGQGDHVVGASGFTSPMDGLKGLSYSFDYGNARFLLIDQFTRIDGTGTDANSNLLDQLGWIGTALSGNEHAFVFAHKGLITQDHVDVLNGANPASNPAAQNTFLGSLSAAGVRYEFAGHDHMHHRALVLSPDQANTVQEIVAASDSYKFYTPAAIPNDVTYDVPAFGFTRETPLAQELYTVGYYIVTVDGPRVTIDHYSSPNGCGDCDLTVTPASFSFTRRDTFGYSLNGREFLVKPGESYTVVADEHEGTAAAILDGTYASNVAVLDGRAVSHLVTTGWSERECGAGSSTLSLWGMATAMGSDQTDPYVLSLSYEPRYLRAEKIGKGGIGLVAKDASGRWVNAVALNSTGAPRYVVGPYQPGYAVGTWGVDPARKVAWAVIDHTNAEFTVTNLEPARNCR